jgi:hypothetical protein
MVHPPRHQDGHNHRHQEQVADGEFHATASRCLVQKWSLQCGAARIPPCQRANKCQSTIAADSLAKRIPLPRRHSRRSHIHPARSTRRHTSPAVVPEGAREPRLAWRQGVVLAVVVHVRLRRLYFMGCFPSSTDVAVRQCLLKFGNAGFRHPRLF